MVDNLSPSSSSAGICNSQLAAVITKHDNIDNPSERKTTICPSKSTVYLGNISYSLTNNDLVKVLEHCGTIVCTKIAKDKMSRKSKGYAFVQFLRVEDAHNCVEEYNGTEVFGRKWSCSIAKDNGRTEEFIRKRTYPDKSRCYECGEFGHLSYKCPKNALGEREPPRKKKRRKGGGGDPSNKSGEGSPSSHDEGDTSDDGEETEIDSLGAAINSQREKMEEEEYRESVISGNYGLLNASADKKPPKRRKFVKDGYFSDEEALAEEEEEKS